MGSRQQGGRSVGVATGVIRISTGQLVTDADRANKVFKELSKGGMQIGTGVKAGTDQAKREIVSLQQTATNAMKQLAAGFALPGVLALTQNLKQMNFTLRQIAGSEEQAVKWLQQMDNLANKLGKSMLDVQRASMPLLPMIKRYGLDLEKTVMLAERLGQLDPVQGTQGAAQAIRELLSGSVGSLAMRFEMGRGDLNKILAEAGGDQQKIIEGLSALVDQAGLTEEALVQAGKEGLNSFSKLKGEIQETTANAFKPLLNDTVIPLVDVFSDMVAELQKVNPELLSTGSHLLGILGTVKALNVVGLGGKFTTGLGVAAAGGELGVMGARFLAKSGMIDNDQLAGATQAEARKMLLETLGQLLVVMADELIDQFGVFLAGVEQIDNFRARFMAALDTLKIAFEIGQKIVSVGFDNAGIVFENAIDKLTAVIELAALDIDNAFRTMLEAIGQLIVDLPGDFGLDERGRNLINAAQSGRASDSDRNALAARAGQDITAGTTSITDAVQPLFNSLTAAIEFLNNLPVDLTPEQLGTIAAMVTSAKQALKELATEVGLLDEVAQATSRGINRTGAVTEPKAFTDEMLEAFAEFQDDLKDLETKAEADRKKAIEEAAKQRNAAGKKLDSELAKNDQEADKSRREIVTKSQRETEQNEKDHRDRIAEINRNAFKDALRAAARFDAQGVFNALDRRKEALDDEKRNYDKQIEQRQQALDQELAAIETARNERRDAINAGYAEELIAINQQRIEKINQINAQLRDEITQKNLAFAELHNKLAAESGNHNIRMLNIHRAGQAQLEAEYAAWFNRMAQRYGTTAQTAPPTQQAPQVQSKGINQSGSPQGTSGSWSQSLQDTFNAALQPKSVRAGMGNSKRSFAIGTGFVPEDGLYGLHRSEIVLDPTTSAMVRSLTSSPSPTQPQMRDAMGKAGNMKSSVRFGDININGDIGGYSPAQIERMIENGTWEAIRGYMEQQAS